MKQLLLIVFCIFPITDSYCASLNSAVDKKPITLESLLDEMVSFDNAANFPLVPYKSMMISSYDRRSVSPDKDSWFANDDGTGYERLDTIDGRIEKVMFESNSPGTVTRIWMSSATKNGATLRFYFDGENKPRFEIPTYDMTNAPFKAGDALSLTHTNYSTDLNNKGGNTFMLPLPYQKSCRITCEEADMGANIWRYYEINYRVYEKGTPIETFSIKKVNALQDKLAHVSQMLLNPPTFREGTPKEQSGWIDKDKTLTLELPTGTQAIKTLEIDAKCRLGDYGKMMRSLVLKVTFDGKETVWAPLSDFSGAGLGARKVDSWYLTADGKGNVISRWVMPYREDAKIEIENLFDHSVHVHIKAHSTAWQWTPNSLYFHTSWKQERGIPVNHQSYKELIMWKFANITGRGVFRGDLLSLYNFAPDWYGEGDEKMWIDDDEFPSHYGTGTEDHYNCSWAPVVPFYTPFGGAPRADNPTSHGFNSFVRTRNLDDIPFNKKYLFEIEMISWNPGIVDYASTSYWYGDISNKALGTSGKEQILIPLIYQP